MLEELRRGGTNAEIAIRLGLSPETVKTHIASMLGKLDLTDRHELAAWVPPTERGRLGVRLALPAALGSLVRPFPWVAAGAVAVAGTVVLVVVLVAVVANGDPVPVAPTPTTTPEPEPAMQTLEFILGCSGGWASLTMEAPEDIAVTMELQPSHRTWDIVDILGQVVGTLRSGRCAADAAVTFADPGHSQVVSAIADSFQYTRWEDSWFTSEFQAEYPPRTHMAEVPALLAPGEYRISPPNTADGLILVIPEGVVVMTTRWAENDEEGYRKAWGVEFRLLMGNQEAVVTFETRGWEINVTASNLSPEALQLVTAFVESIRRSGYY